MSEVLFQESANRIRELNNELVDYIEKIEQKFKYKLLREYETLDLVNNINNCTQDMLDELDFLNSIVNLDKVTETIARIYSSCEGALDHYEAGDKDEYYYYLRVRLKPRIQLYYRQKDIFEKL